MVWFLEHGQNPLACFEDGDQYVTKGHFNLTLPMTAVLFLRLSFILSGTRVEIELDESCFRRDEFLRVA
jgi:hypothetical protein